MKVIYKNVCKLLKISAGFVRSCSSSLPTAPARIPDALMLRGLYNKVVLYVNSTKSYKIVSTGPGLFEYEGRVRMT